MRQNVASIQVEEAPSWEAHSIAAIKEKACPPPSGSGAASFYALVSRFSNIDGGYILKDVRLAHFYKAAPRNAVSHQGRREWLRRLQRRGGQQVAVLPRRLPNVVRRRRGAR